jgi:phage terminase small subunit
MARPRTPTKVLELSGAFKKNPQRLKAREGEPEPTGELSAPVDQLDEIELACWKRIMEIAAPGVIKNSDEGMVEVTARLWAKVKKGQAVINEMTALVSCFKQLGMTPSARAGLSVPQKKTGNKFADV